MPCQAHGEQPDFHRECQALPREWRRHKPALTQLETLLKAAIFQLLEELSLDSLRWQIVKLL